jgi:tetratricopeptide (TPR) repeat protein
MQIGARLHKEKVLEQALAAYERASSLRPDWGVALLRRAICLAQLERVDDALAAFDGAISIGDAARLAALSSKAALLVQLGQKRAATAIFERLLGEPPTSAEDHRARAQALRWLGRVDEALESLALVRRLDPSNRDDLLHEAICLECLERFDEAAAAFERVVTIEPDHAEAWFRQARCLFAIGEHERACACCEKAAALGPASAELLYVHGTALGQLERHQDAIVALERCVVTKADSDLAWHNLGISYQQLGQHTEAVGAFGEALAIAPDLIPSLHASATSLDALGRSAEASSCVATATALARLAKGDAEGGMDKLREARNLDANNWVAMRVLADVLYQAGELDEAVVLLARALELRPQDAVAWTSRARCFTSSGVARRGARATRARWRRIPDPESRSEMQPSISSSTIVSRTRWPSMIERSPSSTTTATPGTGVESAWPVCSGFPKPSTPSARQ